MRSNQSSRRVLRFGAVVTLALMASACATQSPSQPTTTEQAAASEDLDSDTFLRYCNDLYDEGDIYVAVGMCKRAYEMDQSNSAALLKLGAIMVELGHYQGAVEAYATAMSVNPNDDEARYGLAKVYMEAGQFELAEVQLKNAIARNNQDSRFFNAMGVLKDQQGAHQEAQVFYRQGLEVDPVNVALKNNLGLSLSLSGQEGESLALLNEAASSSQSAHVTGTNLVAAQQAPASPAPAESAPTNPAAAVEVEPDPVATSVVDVPAAAESTVETLALAQATPETVNVRPKVAIRTVSAAAEPEDSTVEAESNSVGPNDVEAAAFAGDAYETENSDRQIEEPAFDLSQAALSKPLPQGVEVETSEETVAAPAEITLSGRASGVAESPDSEAAGGGVSESAAASLPSATLQKLQGNEAPTEPEVEVAVTASEPAATQTASTAERRYSVQVGSYGEPATAFRGWEIIAKAAGETLVGYEPRVFEADAGEDKGIVYRLRTGAFENKAEADLVCAEIQASGHGCFVLSTPREDDIREVGQSDVAESDQNS